MMDAGLLDNNIIKHDTKLQFKTDASQQGDVKSQEPQDDGYETSNGADQQQRVPTDQPDQLPTPTEPKEEQEEKQHQHSPGSDVKTKTPSPSPMEGEGKQQGAAEGGDEPDPGLAQREQERNIMEDEMESESEIPNTSSSNNKEGENQVSNEASVEHSEEVAKESKSSSNSPKRLAVNNSCSNNTFSASNSHNDQLINEDSNASMREQLASSPCASISRSNSSSLDRQQNLPFTNNESVENLTTADRNINPLTQEDSSSQSQQGYPINAGTQMDPQMNPYDMKRMQPSAYMPMTSFGGIKREPYDMSTGPPDQQHNDPYAQFKRQHDPYSRENIDPFRNQYKRPEDMYMGNYNKDEMNYNSGFGGIKRENINPYYNPGQFVGGLKREHDEALGYNGIKRECSEDPYSFVDEDAAMNAMLSQQAAMGGPGGQMRPDLMQQHMMQSVPKKRGRKKKIKEECDIKREPGPDGMMGIVKPIKERKKHDRFNGMPEEEVCRRTLPDHLAENLDIIIIGINPGLFAAYKGHHYAGPGNHFWKCLYLSGLTQEQMSADEDYKLLHFGIGFTNMVSRATKGSADLTRKEIKEGSQILLEKLQTFRPKIAVFNGKLIYEVFSGKKDFNFGRQPDTVHGTNTYMWVMPSSSARCAQLPRAADKVPFYAALRRFRDYLNGTLAHVDESELVFPDTTCRREKDENEIRRLLGPDPTETTILEDGTEVPMKKKRGRPKKIKLENGEVVPSAPRPPRPPRPPQPIELGPNGELPPKKKRGRPKKVRPEDQPFMAQQQQQQQNNSMVTPLPNMPLSSQMNMSNQQSMEGSYPQGIMGGSRDYSQNIAMDTSSSMLYGSSMQQNTMSGGGPIQTQQSLAVNIPQTSPYFSQGLGSGNQDNGDVMQPGTPGGLNMRNQSGFGHSPGPFSQSPRSQNVGYGSSPRPAGYSQSPQRHQMAGSFSNSPAHQQQSSALPFSQSPVPQTAQYSQSPPLRPLSQNHNYSQQSPVPGHPYSRSPVPQNNTPTYSQQSPMFAQSPANMPHPYSQSPVPQSQRFSQASPASQNMAYPCRSPGPPLDHGGTSYQPSSPLQQSSSYEMSPVRANQTPYSQSPIPQNSNIYAHPQMMSPGSSQNYSQRNNPYSPASHLHSGYGQSPIHQPQAKQNTTFNQSPPQNMSMSAASNSGPTTSTLPQQYPSDLSSEISAAISSPGPSSPVIGHIDFEPPIINDSQMQTQEAENSSSRSISQRTSPGGDQLTPNDLAQSSSNMVSETALNAMGDVSHASSHDSNDIMDTCTNPMMQMTPNHQLNSQNRHSALNLIGPSSSSNNSSPIPSALDATKPGLDMSRGSAAFGASSTMYNSQPGSNEAQSPVSNEQRLGFQVPTPSGSANSSYGTVTPVAADLSNVPRNSPRDIDNVSVASVSSQHERTYPLGGYPDAVGSPRQSDTGSLLAHHSASMYHSNPFSRMGSTPPQSSPFSQGGGAFRGMSGLEHGSPQQGPVDYGSPVKQPTVTTKQQDVSSKSLSGLESLVDQIPSIADGGPPQLSSEMTTHPAATVGPTPVPALENPYAAHTPLYSPYPYQPTPYAPPPVSNNSYSSLAASGFVGYPGSPYGQLMRPTPGYLPEALSAYHPAHHSGYPGLSTQQYGPGAGYGPGGPTPNYSAYYNGYGSPSIPNTPNMPPYLTSHVLDHIHKNAAADASSVSFGGFC